jgi:hypothetical protein
MSKHAKLKSDGSDQGLSELELLRQSQAIMTFLSDIITTTNERDYMRAWRWMCSNVTWTS